jgi:hypothetical protein
MKNIKVKLEKSTKTKHETFMLTLIESSVVAVGAMKVIKRNSYHLVVAEDLPVNTELEFDLDLFNVEERSFLTEAGETKFATFLKLK